MGRSNPWGNPSVYRYPVNSYVKMPDYCRAIRRSLNLFGKDVGQAINRTPTEICRFELHKNKISIYEVKKIMKFFRKVKLMRMFGKNYKEGMFKS